MILSDDERRNFWVGLGELQAEVNQLRGLFQNEQEIKTEDYAFWNMQLAEIFKKLQDFQLKFGVAFTKK